MEWVPIVLLVFKLLVLGTGMFYAIKWHHDQDKKQEKETGSAQSPTEMRLFATMLIALTLSLLGIMYAGVWGDAADGGFGGALGCAFTLLMGLMSRPAADATLARANPDPQASLQAQNESLRAACLAQLACAHREKIYLIVASLISTLAWKYGAIAATWLNIRS